VTPVRFRHLWRGGSSGSERRPVGTKRRDLEVATIAGDGDGAMQVGAKDGHVLTGEGVQDTRMRMAIGVSGS
jgi:hypothetical protein